MEESTSGQLGIRPTTGDTLRPVTAVSTLTIPDSRILSFGVFGQLGMLVLRIPMFHILTSAPSTIFAFHPRSSQTTSSYLYLSALSLYLGTDFKSCQRSGSQSIDGEDFPEAIVISEYSD